MTKFDKYNEVVLGKTRIELEDENGVVNEEYDIVVKNSEKMLMLNYFTATGRAQKELTSVDSRFTEKIEGLMVNLFKRAYPEDNIESIRKMVDKRFIDLIAAFMVGFEWTTREKMKEAEAQLSEESLGKKKGDDIQPKN